MEAAVRISANVQNSPGQNRVELKTGDQSHSIVVPPRSGGPGSSVNGGELLFLALATCYCNDIYREAAKRKMQVERVEVDVAGDFAAEGHSAKNVTYRAKVTAKASEQEIRELMQHTDTVAEIHNTLREMTPVVLNEIEAVPS
jgi:organic hydroperoxide reductase OsmC/OhrA